MTQPSVVPSAACTALADQPELVAAKATVTPAELVNERSVVDVEYADASA
jgi:hypothetical protein